MPMFHANRQPGRLLITTTIALGLISVSGCDKSDPQLAPAPPPEVMVTEVVQQNVPITLDVAGTVQSMKSVEIIPRVSGYLTKRQYTEGSPIKKGDPLYQIDPRPYQASLDALKAQFAVDQANLQLRVDDAKRFTTLAKKGFASEEREEDSVTKEKEARATTAKDQADIDNAQLNLSFTSITAPFNGFVQNTQAHVGDLVTQHKSVLTTVLQLDPIYVITNISREEGYRMQQLRTKGWAPAEQNAYIGELTLPDGSTYPQQGQLNYFSAQLDPSTDSFELRYQFPNTTIGKTMALIPGQYIPLRMIIGHHPDALLIPQKALIETSEGMFVYVVGSDNKAEKRKVEKGPAYQLSWVINKGLKKGEKVVSDGQLKIHKSGMSVKPRAATATPKDNKETKNRE